MIISICKGAYAVCSFAKEKILTYCEDYNSQQVESIKQKIEKGEIQLVESHVGRGERLWNIAQSLDDRVGISIDTRDVVDYIKVINEVKGVDTTVLKEGQVIYLPQSLDGVF